MEDIRDQMEMTARCRVKGDFQVCKLGIWRSDDHFRDTKKSRRKKSQNGKRRNK